MCDSKLIVREWQERAKQTVVGIEVGKGGVEMQH